jgi:uncharacterized protein (TIGR02678 family)
MTLLDNDRNSRNIRSHQRHAEREEFRTSVRALLMTPLMAPAHEDFAAVRRNADALRDWFARETGWVLQIEREGARLFKRPADLASPVRGLTGYDRRRYVLLCLACAILERADAQITLCLLGDRLLQLSAELTLVQGSFTFTLETHRERRELVTVCRTLLDLGILQRVVGDEEAFVSGGGEQADALYDIQRRLLAGMLAAVRGPSTWAPEEAPGSLEERLHAMVDEHVADSDDGRRTALRHQLARRLLDDPVVYLETLDPESRPYFTNQRGPMAARLCDAAGLVAEQRAEGLALVDEAGSLTDVAMPAEGTEAHATLLVAEHLAAACRRLPPVESIRQQDVVDFLREVRARYGRYWRKSAREAGAEHELAATALERLEKLQLIVRNADMIRPLPAIARFSVGDAEVRDYRDASKTQKTQMAFDLK